MQIQEENGLTNLIYFHTDLMLALAPDCVWVSPINTSLSFFPGALCFVTGDALIVYTPHCVPGTIPYAEKYYSLPWGIRNFDAPHLERREEAFWFHDIVDVLMEEQEEAYLG